MCWITDGLMDVIAFAFTWQRITRLFEITVLTTSHTHSGYAGSIGLGGALMLGGWDILVAKILSFFIAFGLLMPLSLVRDKMYVHPQTSTSIPYSCPNELLTPSPCQNYHAHRHIRSLAHRLLVHRSRKRVKMVLSLPWTHLHLVPFLGPHRRAIQEKTKLERYHSIYRHVPERASPRCV